MVFVPFTISAVKALADLVDLGLKKKGPKTATVENLTAILNKNGVQIRQIPSDHYQVRFHAPFCLHGGSVLSASCAF
jgi:hypothetical protein